MITKTKTNWRSRGASLVCTMVSTTVLSIAVIGTANFRYYAALDSRKAVVYSNASRIAATLNESWRAVNGAVTYDPVAHLGSDLAITQSAVPEVEDDETFTLLGSYVVVLNGTSYDATLSWKDVSAGLKALNVVVTWPPLSARDSGADRSFKLTTYALITD